MLRITPHELLAERRVMLDPEAGQIARDLHWALVRREQVEHEWDLAVADRGRACEAEKVLHARRDPRRLIDLVVDRRAAAAELQVRGCETIDERALVAELRVEELEQAELAELVERDRAFARAREDRGERVVGGRDEIRDE